MPSHIVLAYSGGLDTSVGVHWLKEHLDAQVTAVLVDLGQPIADLEAAKQRAVENGASECIVVDAKQRFADEHVAPAILANALYEGAYPLATALGRPLIATILVDVAQQVGADAIAHGCTGKGNDQVRIEAAIKALAPQIECIAPQRSHPMSRPEVLRYAATHGLRLPPIKDNPYSIDENLYGRSCEGHDVESPAAPPVEAAFGWTVAPAAAPAAGLEFTIGFEHGLPAALDGVKLPLAEVVQRLNQHLGAHGVGRIDHVENRLVGIKTRELYEAPAAVGILMAKQALESLVLGRDEAHLKPFLEQQYANLVYDGKWFTPAREALQAFFAQIQQPVTGTVTLLAQQGRLTVLARQSTQCLFVADLATYSDGDGFHHQAAEGFIELWSLPMAVRAKVAQAIEEAASAEGAPAADPQAHPPTSQAQAASTPSTASPAAPLQSAPAPSTPPVHARLATQPLQEDTAR